MVIHFPAFCCALPALFRTHTAVVVVVLSTFRRTCIADICAYGALLRNTFAVQARQSCSRCAYGTAFHIQPYTAAHVVHMFFLEAGYRTVVTGSGTFKAGLYTALISIPVCHKDTDLQGSRSKNNAITYVYAIKTSGS